MSATKMAEPVYEPWMFGLGPKPPVSIAPVDRDAEIARLAAEQATEMAAKNVQLGEAGWLVSKQRPARDSDDDAGDELASMGLHGCRVMRPSREGVVYTHTQKKKRETSKARKRHREPKA